MFFEYWHEGITFIIIFMVLISVPCVGVALIGYRMINKLGYYPSKTPFIQMSIVFTLALIEIVSFALIIGFFKIITADQQGV